MPIRVDDFDFMRCEEESEAEYVNAMLDYNDAFLESEDSLGNTSWSYTLNHLARWKRAASWFRGPEYGPLHIREIFFSDKIKTMEKGVELVLVRMLFGNKKTLAEARTLGYKRYRDLIRAVGKQGRRQ